MFPSEVTADSSVEIRQCGGDDFEENLAYNGKTLPSATIAVIYEWISEDIYVDDSKRATISPEREFSAFPAGIHWTTALSERLFARGKRVGKRQSGNECGTRYTLRWKC